MFCIKCGEQIPEGNRFCIKCGAPVETVEEQEDLDREPTVQENLAAGVADIMREDADAAEEAKKEAEGDEKPDAETPPAVDRPVYSAPPADNAYVPPVQAKGRKQGKSPKSIIGIIIAAVAVIAIAVVGVIIALKFKKTEVDLSKYLEVECEGYDGFGRVNAQFDTDKFVKDYRDKIKPNKKIKSLINEHDDLDDLADNADIKFTKKKDVARLFALIYCGNGAFEDNEKLNSGTLENGDVLHYKWNFETADMNEEEALEFAAKAFNVKLTASDVDVEVKDLEKIEKFDAFRDVEVEFSGTAPNAQARLVRYPEDNYLNYSINNNSGLSNGDTVTVTVSYWGSEEDYAQQYKRLPESTTKDFKVENLDEYIGDVSQISEADLDVMKNECRDSILKNVADQRRDYLSVESVNFDSAYLLTAKSSDNYRNNTIVIIDKVTVKCASSKQSAQYNSYYTYTSFHDAVRTGNGDMLVDLSNCDQASDYMYFEYDPENRGWTESFSLRGYDSYDRLFSDAITRNVDKFKYEQINAASEVSNSTVSDYFENSDNESEEGKGDYIFPDSSINALTKDDLKELDADSCRYARNEIYARHGRMFDDEELQKYFNSKSWYEGTVKPSDFDESVLNQTEKDNIKLITDYEKKKGYR